MIYGIVYELICVVTDLHYVGQTIHTLDERWRGHCDAALRRGINWELSKSIREHGPDNFRRRVLCECDSREELDASERKFIIELQTMWPMGYNMTNGNSGPCELTRKLISERTREAMSDPIVKQKMSDKAKLRSHDVQVEAMRASRVGKQCPPDVRKKISDAHRGMKHSQEAISKMKAHKFSEEHRLKLSEAAKRRKKSTHDLKERQ